MEVNMLNRLAGVGTAVADYTVTVFESLLRRDLRYRLKYCGDFRAVFCVYFVCRADMLSRNDENMRRRLRIYVAEGEYAVVGIDGRRRDLTRYDFAEDAVHFSFPFGSAADSRLTVIAVIIIPFQDGFINMNRTNYFDVHTHIFPEAIAPAATRNLGRFYDFTVDGNGTSAELGDVSLRNGVSGLLVLCTATSAHQVRRVNEVAAAECAGMRERGLDVECFGSYHQDETDPDGVFEQAERLGLRGFKVHPDIQGVDIDDERLFPLYAYCEGRLPVYLHMGDGRPQYRFSEARRLVRIKEKFPRLRVGAAHLGGYTAWEESHILKGIPDVWFDTSSSVWAIGPERAGELIHMLGADRCMFGTDYPVKLADTEIPLFEQIDLNDAEREAIARGNAMRFLGRNG